MYMVNSFCSLIVFGIVILFVDILEKVIGIVIIV
mgnify:CR=1 FL=1